MEPAIHLYNAYSGLHAMEQIALLNFFKQNAPETDNVAIQEALDCALKNKPSFGGFVLTHTLQGKIVAALVVNKTGMQCFKSENLLVLATLHQDYANHPELLETLINKAIYQSDGDISFYAKSKNPAIMMAKRMGFNEQYVELKFKPVAAAAKVRV
jgi:[ribosomal protein S18]-alanine N-acetyltransferase